MLKTDDGVIYFYKRFLRLSENWESPTDIKKQHHWNAQDNLHIIYPLVYHAQTNNIKHETHTQMKQFISIIHKLKLSHR